MKPYFKGQQPSECGHFFPDVFLLKAIKKKRYVILIIKCLICGKTTRQKKEFYEVGKDFLQEKNIYNKMRDVETWRRKEIKRMSKI
jgi:hypothetical protein